MQQKSYRRAIVTGLIAAAAPVLEAAQPTVPYVPTPQDVVDRMLEVAKVGPADYLIDLGSGDGRIVITAARKHGARGFGVDLNPERVRESNENARRAGVTDRVAFYQRDLFETDLAEATVVTMYLLPRVNMQLRPRLLELRPGTRIVSHDFSMEDWQPDARIRVDTPGKWGGTGGTSEVFYWVVPAKVAGEWQWELSIRGKPVAYRISLDQKFQSVSGQAMAAGRRVMLHDVRLSGAALEFAFGVEVNGGMVRHRFTGRVDGDAITGTAAVSGDRMESRQEWVARRAAAAAGGSPVGARSRADAVIAGVMH